MAPPRKPPESPLALGPALHWGQEALAQAGVEDARLTAEVFLAEALDLGRAQLYARPEQPLTSKQARSYARMVRRALRGEPLAYIVGHREFFGLDLIVAPGVLIPRPETELVVERALAWAQPREGEALIIADVGTGSGALAVSLAAHLPAARLYALDRSLEALNLAGLNSIRHGVASRVVSLHGDLLAPLPKPADLIVANLPYLTPAEMRALPRPLRYEPQEALYGGPDGLGFYRELMAQAPHCLRPNGAIIFEIGAGQGAAAQALARRHFPTATIYLWPDLAGRDRVVEVGT